MGYNITKKRTPKYLYPLFQWYACKLAKLSATYIAKCMTTINKIYIFLHYRPKINKMELDVGFSAPFPPGAQTFLCRTKFSAFILGKMS